MQNQTKDLPWRSAGTPYLKTVNKALGRLRLDSTKSRVASNVGGPLPNYAGNALASNAERLISKSLQRKVRQRASQLEWPQGQSSPNDQTRADLLYNKHVETRVTDVDATARIQGWSWRRGTALSSQLMKGLWRVVSERRVNASAGPSLGLSELCALNHVREHLVVNVPRHHTFSRAFAATTTSVLRTSIEAMLNVSRKVAPAPERRAAPRNKPLDHEELAALRSFLGFFSVVELESLRVKLEPFNAKSRHRQLTQISRSTVPAFLTSLILVSKFQHVLFQRRRNSTPRPNRQPLAIALGPIQSALAMKLPSEQRLVMSVVEHMDPAWSRAFLRRTRFLDSDFQGDVLAVISMTSTALRTGCALPQITPCPLLARFQSQSQSQSQMHGLGLHVIHKDAEEDYGLPRHLTLETLQNEQYLRFCVGVATARWWGEQYHIRSAALGMAARPGNVNMNGRTGVPMGSRTQSLQLQAPGEIV
ncbi:hypothetical protein HMN09_00033200 [Mycena chlorophos]|uniref:DUF2421 domain-containing protein n=1 Tax=Mycena chlorophos TaxID=658473 RepID=A0A8H6WM79_MYCCL|nr:hypothetical protein HMN09_00033200 [Mycena chlorophos]